MFGVGSAGPRWIYYAGLVLLLGSWILLGKHLRDHRDERLLVLVTAWALPMMIAMPLASRDLWAYAAQGNLDHHGLNPYTASPADLPGVFAQNVSPRWVQSTTPYGPLWLIIGRLIAIMCGSHVQVTVFVLRIPALLGLALIVWSLPRLAARFGVRADVALWLVAANPLMIVLSLGGGHNDLLMTGLMALGAVAAVSGSWRSLALAAALMAGAAGIKSPAAIGVIFVVPLWLQFADRDRERAWLPRLARASVVAAASAVATFAVITLICGHGFGWLDQVGPKSPVVNWMSLPTAAAMLAKLARGATVSALTVDHTMQDWRTAGLILAALVVVALWLRSTWVAVAADDRSRTAGEQLRRPIADLAAAMFVITVLAPAVQPWYFDWSLLFVVLVGLRGPAVAALIGGSVFLLLLIRPLGTALFMETGLIPIAAGTALIGWLACGCSVPRDNDPDGAGPGMGGDCRPELCTDAGHQSR